MSSDLTTLRLHGTVTQGNAGLSGAQVSVTGDAIMPSWWTPGGSTDADGKYEFRSDHPAAAWHGDAGQRGPFRRTGERDGRRDHAELVDAGRFDGRRRQV